MKLSRKRVLTALALVAGAFLAATAPASAQTFADLEALESGDSFPQDWNFENSSMSTPTIEPAGGGPSAGAYQAQGGYAGSEGSYSGMGDAPGVFGTPGPFFNKRVAGPEDSTYTLGPLDVIEVKVMRHPEVSGIYEINQEGRIQYEFTGDIEVIGQTKEEATQSIAARLAEYIVNPEVSIKILGYNSKVVYVVGEVYNPGKIYMRGDVITVRDALLEAGLPMLSGVTKKSHLFTPSDSGKVKKQYVSVYALLYEGDLRENHEMSPGDVLYVPPTFLTKTMRAIQPVAAPIGTAAGTGRSVYGY